MSATTRMAHCGTGHGHAAGKVRALLEHPGVEVAGVLEFDPARRTALEGSGPYAGVHWFDS